MNINYNLIFQFGSYNFVQIIKQFGLW